MLGEIHCACAGTSSPAQGPDLIPWLPPSLCTRGDREGECWPLSLTPTPLSSPLLPLTSTCGCMPLPWHGPVPAQRMALLDEEMIRSDVIDPPSALECIQSHRMRKLISDLCMDLCLTFSICPFPSSCEQLSRKAIRALMAVRRKTRPAPGLLFLTLPQSVNRLCQKVHPRNLAGGGVRAASGSSATASSCGLCSPSPLCCPQGHETSHLCRQQPTGSHTGRSPLPPPSWPSTSHRFLPSQENSILSSQLGLQSMGRGRRAAGLSRGVNRICLALCLRRSPRTQSRAPFLTCVLHHALACLLWLPRAEQPLQT